MCLDRGYPAELDGSTRVPDRGLPGGGADSGSGLGVGGGSAPLDTTGGHRGSPGGDGLSGALVAGCFRAGRLLAGGCFRHCHPPGFACGMETGGGSRTPGVDHADGH